MKEVLLSSYIRWKNAPKWPKDHKFTSTYKVKNITL